MHDCKNVTVSNEKVERKRIIIEDNVWIGRGVTVLKGIRIGQGSVIGAILVVSKDVPPFSVVAGNPSKVVRSLE